MVSCAPQEAHFPDSQIRADSLQEPKTPGQKKGTKRKGGSRKVSEAELHIRSQANESRVALLALLVKGLLWVHVKPDERVR